MAHREDAQGDKGTVSGSLYCGDHDHYAFLGDVFSLFSHANVLQRDMYPSATKFEAEIIAMTSDLLHGSGVGVVTSGGSESLITALYSYREHARETRGVTRPNVVMPTHRARRARQGRALDGHRGAARAAHRRVRRRRRRDGRADRRPDDRARRQRRELRARPHRPDRADRGARAAATASACTSTAASAAGCCRGRRSSATTSRSWDFRVPGVTSISADTHKYGYALKGSSVLLYRDRDLRKNQYFTYPDWPGGLYLSPGLAGSRSGGIIASTWAAILATGRVGYLAAADGIMRTATGITAGIRSEVPELEVIGDPTFLVAFKAPGEATSTSTWSTTRSRPRVGG